MVDAPCILYRHYVGRMIHSIAQYNTSVSHKYAFACVKWFKIVNQPYADPEREGWNTCSADAYAYVPLVYILLKYEVSCTLSL